MSKQKSCHYCKKILNEEKDEIVEFEMGKKKIVKKCACKSCRNEKIYKDKFYENLFAYLDIQPIKDNNFYMIIANMCKPYSWEIMLDAVIKKENDIIKNKNMPMPYIIKIISNQLVFSERDIRQKKEEKELTKINVHNIIKNEGIKEIKYNKKQEHDDMSNFLD